MVRNLISTEDDIKKKRINKNCFGFIHVITSNNNNQFHASNYTFLHILQQLFLFSVGEKSPLMQSAMKITYKMYCLSFCTRHW